jgi:outer membrane protein assembly factor BamB
MRNRFISLMMAVLSLCVGSASAVDISSVPMDPGGLPEAGQSITLRGKVFADGNPLPGVYVSDGEKIVKTDQDGRYSFRMKIEDPRHIFVIVPSGYRANGPFYRRVALTKDDTYTYDFQLAEDPASRSPKFSFVAGADIQYLESFRKKYPQLTDDFSAMAALGQDAAFAIFAGDHTSAGKLEDLQILKKASVEVWKKPFHAGFGAHDILNPTGFGNFMDVFGPYYYSADYGGCHFIFLVSERAYLKGKPWERQIRWLKRDVALQPADKPIIVVCHTPEELADELGQIGKSHNLIAVIRGHYHINSNYHGPGNVPVICSSPWRSLDWGAFTRKCLIVTIDNGKIISRMKVLGQEKRLIITSPAPGSTVSAGKVFIRANVLNSSEDISKVNYQINQADGKDVTGALNQYGDLSWGDKIDVSPGQYKLTITAEVSNGTPWSESADFICVDAPAVKPQTGDDWPGLFGSEKIGRVSESKITPPLQLAWIGHTGGLIYYFSSPIVVDGKVLIGVCDDNVNPEQAGIVCFDAKSGKRLWKRRTLADLHSSIVSHDGSVYAADNDGRVSCFDINTGEVKWTISSHPLTFGWTMCMGPVNADRQGVYVAPDFAPLTCFVPQTGQKHWQLEHRGANYQTSGMSISDGVGYTSQKGWYASVNPANGQYIWRIGSGNARGVSTPMRHGNRLYVTHAKTLRAADAKTGKELWKADLDGPMTQCPGMAVAHDGRVFVTHGNGIWAFDAQTGKRLWKHQTDDPKDFHEGKWQSLSESSSPAVAGRYVYVGSDNGHFYCLETATGKVAWSYYIGVPIKSSPALSGNMVFISGFDGNVYAFTATTTP